MEVLAIVKRFHVRFGRFIPSRGHAGYGKSLKGLRVLKLTVPRACGIRDVPQGSPHLAGMRDTGTRDVPQGSPHLAGGA
eukprot:365548-Chlamydomonas_euryale.AAC.2